jgi:hypothetical protein
VFRSKRSAIDALRGLADEHRLCLRALGFEKPGKGSCFRHQIKRCAGVCAGRESVHAHHARTAAALAALKTAAWPWRGPVGIVEEDREREAVDVHVVDNWCLLGSARSEDEVAELLKGSRPALRPRPVQDPVAPSCAGAQGRGTGRRTPAALVHVELVVPRFPGAGPAPRYSCCSRAAAPKAQRRR